MSHAKRRTSVQAQLGTLGLVVLLCLTGGAQSRDATILIGETAASSRYAASASDPVDLIIDFGEPLEEGDRVHVYLPLFRGASNTFGTFSASAIAEHPIPANPRENGIIARNVDQEFDAGLTSAYWDAPTETLRLVVASVNVSSIVLDSKFLRVGIAPSGRPNGKGPLPPAGGVRESWWYRTANFRVFSGSACGGGRSGRVGFPPEACSGQRLEKTFVAARSSKVSTAGSRLFVHPELGQPGTFEFPQFSYAVIHGSSTGMGEDNCMTVSLVPSVAIMSDAETLAQITISGLSAADGQLQDSGDIQLFASQTLCSAGIASMPRDLTGFFQTPAATPQPNKARWDRDAGEVVLQLQPGRFLQAFQVLSFTFKLTNPAAVEGEKAPVLGATGRYCDDLHFCTAANSAVLNIPATPFHSASQVLGTEPNQFDWRVIWQSSADPDVSAAIHVTLSPNVDIRDTNLEITNLCAPLADGNLVNLTSNRDNFGDRINGVHPIELGSPDKSVADPQAAWAAEENTLTIRVGSVGLEAGQVYAAAILFRTPSQSSPVCVPLVRTAEVRAQYMTTDTLGVVNPPQLNTFLLGQSSARPGLTNYLCVTLSPNSDLASTAGATGGTSKITIAGLTGTLTPSTSAGQLYSCPRKLTDKRIDRAALTPLTNTRYVNDGFEFDATTGSVVISVRDGQRVLKSSETLFAIPLRNAVPADTTACAAPTIEVSGSFNQGPVAFPAAPASKRALEGGREDGDICPLFVHRPQFTNRILAQTSSVAGADNVIAVTLRTNFDMLGTSSAPATITIDGLLGSDTPTSTSFLSSILPIDKRNFLKFSSAAWTQSTGRLVLQLSTALTDCPVPTEENQGGGSGAGSDCLRADYPYSFGIALKNPADPQEPPAEVRIRGAAMIEGEAAETALELVAFPSKKELMPLFVPAKGETFRTISMGQSNPTPFAATTICVTFSVWNEIPAGQAALTISGLTGFTDTAGPTLALYGSSALSELPEALAGKFVSETAGGVLDAMKWDADLGVWSGELVADQGLPANANVTLCGVFKNPATPRPCHHETKVELQLKAEGKTLSMEGDAMGVEHPACVGFVETVRFPLASVRPSTNATNALSTLYIEMAANVPVTEGEITIAGLYGYQRVAGDGAETGPVPIEVTKNGITDTSTLEPTADWDGRSKLTFKVKADVGNPGLQPAVKVPTASLAARSEDVLVVKVQLKNGEQQAPYEVSIHASQYNMVPWAVDVGPEDTRLNVVVVPDGVKFTYNDWVSNLNPELGVSLAFTDGPDAARVDLPAEMPFPEWLTIEGTELLPNTEVELPAGWPFVKSQLSSTVLDISLPARNLDDPEGVPLLLRSSVLREVDPEVVPDIERSRRRLLAACPPGYETRIIPVGAPVEQSCNCPSDCADRASCTVRASGRYGAFMVKEDLCAPPTAIRNNAGKIVAIVAAVFLVIVAAVLFYLWRTYPDLFKKDADEDEKVPIDVPPEDAPAPVTTFPQPVPQPIPQPPPPVTRDLQIPPPVPVPAPAPVPVPAPAIYPAPPQGYLPPAPAPVARNPMSGLQDMDPTHVPDHELVALNQWEAGIQDMDPTHVPVTPPGQLHAFSNQEIASGQMVEGHLWPGAPSINMPPTVDPSTVPAPVPYMQFPPNTMAQPGPTSANYDYQGGVA